MLTDTSTGEIRLSEPERRRMAYWCESAPDGVRTPEGLRRFAEQQKLLYPGDDPEAQFLRGLIDQTVREILGTHDGSQAPHSNSNAAECRQEHREETIEAQVANLQASRIAALLSLQAAVLGRPNWFRSEDSTSQASNEC